MNINAAVCFPRIWNIVALHKNIEWSVIQQACHFWDILLLGLVAVIHKFDSFW